MYVLVTHPDPVPSPPHLRCSAVRPGPVPRAAPQPPEQRRLPAPSRPVCPQHTLPPAAYAAGSIMRDQVMMHMTGSAADQGGATNHQSENEPLGLKVPRGEPRAIPFPSFRGLFVPGVVNALSLPSNSWHCLSPPSALLTSRQAGSACSTSLCLRRLPGCPSPADPSPCRKPASPVSKVSTRCSVTAIADFLTVG